LSDVLQQRIEVDVIVLCVRVRVHSAAVVLLSGTRTSSS
jgi:hypothetical protein